MVVEGSCLPDIVLIAPFWVAVVDEGVEPEELAVAPATSNSFLFLSTTSSRIRLSLAKDLIRLSSRSSAAESGLMVLLLFELAVEGLRATLVI